MLCAFTLAAAAELPLDEAGNIKTAEQVRDRVISLLDSPVTITYPESWVSDPIAVAEYSKVVSVTLMASDRKSVECSLDRQFDEGLPWIWDARHWFALSPEGHLHLPSDSPAPVLGRLARIRCRPSRAGEATLINAWVYLRTD